MTVAWMLANSDHGALIVNRLDYNQSFDGGVYGVGAQIMETAAYDASEVAMLKALLPVRRKYHRDGVVALDCGANIGVHALEWSRLMRGWGAVIAIEAQERVFYALAGNLAIQNCRNARALWAAVSDNDGWLEIPEPDYWAPGSFGSFELRQRFGVEHIGQEIDYDKPMLSVRTVRLDSLGLDRCDLIKLDVEGMELEALRGGAELIRRHKPILFVEHIKSDKGALECLLKEWGYRTFVNAMNILAVHENDKSIEHVKMERVGPKEPD